jgi:hypothetical protein
MLYTITQMMSAEAGMYLVEGRDATLVVMWALVERNEAVVSQKIIGLTVSDLGDNLQDAISDYWNAEEPPLYTTKVNPSTHNITR